MKVEVCTLTGEEDNECNLSLGLTASGQIAKASDL